MAPEHDAVLFGVSGLARSGARIAGVKQCRSSPMPPWWSSKRQGVQQGVRRRVARKHQPAGWRIRRKPRSGSSSRNSRTRWSVMPCGNPSGAAPPAYPIGLAFVLGTPSTVGTDTSSCAGAW